MRSRSVSHTFVCVLDLHAIGFAVLERLTRPKSSQRPRYGEPRASLFVFCCALADLAMRALHIYIRGQSRACVCVCVIFRRCIRAKTHSTAHTSTNKYIHTHTRMTRRRRQHTASQNQQSAMRRECEIKNSPEKYPTCMSNGAELKNALRARCAEKARTHNQRSFVRSLDATRRKHTCKHTFVQRCVCLCFEWTTRTHIYCGQHPATHILKGSTRARFSYIRASSARE